MGLSVEIVAEKRKSRHRIARDVPLSARHDDQEKLLEVDNVIVCAGQLPQRELQEALQAKGQTVHLIGGADVAAELDAKRAIKQGAELAASI